MITVLFVCLGNICRSPMAEGVFKHLVEQAGLADQITCDSAGTSGYHLGDQPDKRMHRVAKKYGIELNHCARQLQAADFEQSDYIVAMDNSNHQNIVAHIGCQPAFTSKIVLMRSYDEALPNADVPDPYYGQMDGFEEVYQILWRTNRRFLHYLIEKHQLVPGIQ